MWGICSFVSQSHLCSFALKKRAIHSKNCLLFSPCFWQFFSVFSIFMTKNKSLPLLLAWSFFTKERLWAKQTSIPSLFTKKGPWAICSWKRVNCYFILFPQKTSDSQKNQRVNSQLWTMAFFYIELISDKLRLFLSLPRICS